VTLKKDTLDNSASASVRNLTEVLQLL